MPPPGCTLSYPPKVFDRCLRPRVVLCPSCLTLGMSRRRGETYPSVHPIEGYVGPPP